MNKISTSKIENTTNLIKTITKETPRYVKTTQKNITNVADTASSQSARIKLNKDTQDATEILKSVNATNIYQKTDNEPFYKIIEQNGQKILITSSMENPKNAVVTFFNGGTPGKCFECAFEELETRCGIHI